MKQRKNQLVPPGAKANCPLKAARFRERTDGQPAFVVVRTEKRSWFALAITGFGALLLRYLRTVRERARTARSQ